MANKQHFIIDLLFVSINNYPDTATITTEWNIINCKMQNKTIQFTSLLTTLHFCAFQQCIVSQVESYLGRLLNATTNRCRSNLCLRLPQLGASCAPICDCNENCECNLVENFCEWNEKVETERRLALSERWKPTNWDWKLHFKLIKWWN